MTLHTCIRTTFAELDEICESVSTMRSIPLLLLTILYSTIIRGQGNLVPNPSFENLDSCSFAFGQISNAIGWSGLNLSPDYFNRCAIDPRCSIPDNLFGFQLPFETTDNAYCGIIMHPFDDTLHEIIGINLLQPLTIGKRYFVSFMAAPSYITTNPPGNVIVCYCNKIGAKFFTQPILPGNHSPGLISDFAQVSSDVMLNDTINWFHFSESFIADSAYTFLAIGHFFKLGNMTCECINSLGFKAYTYIDNVCVAADSLVCNTSNGDEPENGNDIEIKIEDEIQQIVVFLRNPAKQNFCEIFDTIGQIVYSKEMRSSENYIYFGNWSSGIYLMRINEKTYKLRLLKKN